MSEPEYRDWLEEQAKRMSYAVKAMEASSSTLVLPDCRERLERYQQALATIAEFDEFVRDSAK